MAQLTKKLIGDTMKITWVHSGTAPSSISAAIYTGSEALVNSAAMVSSGDGHYYSLYTLPNSVGFYVAETLATISGKPYKNRMKFKAVKGDTDG